MFSISNFSEFGPRGGGRNFSIISEIQNILNYPRGRVGGLVKSNIHINSNFIYGKDKLGLKLAKFYFN